MPLNLLSEIWTVKTSQPFASLQLEQSWITHDVVRLSCACFQPAWGAKEGDMPQNLYLPKEREYLINVCLVAICETIN